MSRTLLLFFQTCFIITIFSGYSAGSALDAIKGAAGGVLGVLKTEATKKVAAVKQKGIDTVAGVRNTASSKIATAVGAASAKASGVAETVKSKVDGAKEKGEQLASNVKGKTAPAETTSPETVEEPKTDAAATTADAPTAATTTATVDKNSSPEEDVAEIDPAIVAAVDPVFSNGEKIERLKFISAKGLKFTDEHAQYFARKLGELAAKGVEKLTLNLAGNSMTAVGLGILLETMKANPKLVSSISLSHNKIGDEGATLLASYLPNLAALKFVILDETGITGDGVLAILSEVAKNENGVLQMLDFSNNAVTSDYWGLMVAGTKPGALRKGILEDGIVFSKSQLNVPENSQIPPVIQLS
jgi:hypothetical protein